VIFHPFAETPPRPHWGDRFEIWLAGSCRRRNHPSQILWQSVKGFWSYHTPNFALLHRNSSVLAGRPYNSVSTTVLHCDMFLNSLVVLWSNLSHALADREWREIWQFDMQVSFLANVNSRSRSRSLYAIARPSVVCRLPVTFVLPTQPVENLRNFFPPFGTLAIRWLPRKILRRSSQGKPSVGGFKRKRDSQI